MSDYIEFKLNGRKCRLNREDSYDLQIWFVKCGQSVLKIPRWKKVKLYKTKTGYFACNVSKRSYKHHRIVYFAHNPNWNIYDTSHTNIIDHIDGNPLNNRVNNLRLGTQAQNCQNKIAKGYNFDKRRNKWRSYINLNRKQIWLGYFDTEEEAKQARAEAVKKYHPFARQS
jgi:hypothetical protein